MMSLLYMKEERAIVYNLHHQICLVSLSCHNLLMLLHSIGFYSGQCQSVHIHIERIEISDVPDSEEERKQWLFERFQKKDK